MFVVYSMVCVSSIAAHLAWELYQDYKKQCIRDEADKEPARLNVVRGIFRQHNEQFKANGFKPPQGRA